GPGGVEPAGPGRHVQVGVTSAHQDDPTPVRLRMLHRQPPRGFANRFRHHNVWAVCVLVPGACSMPILSAADLDHFDQQGYVVVRQAIDPERARRTVEAINDFLGGGGRDGWYQPPHAKGGFLSMYHHPVLWENRQDPRIY